MKLHLPLSLRSSLLACMAFVGFTLGAAGAADSQAKTDLGDVMFVGDSITHGFQGKGSWRWSFAKILIDNNIYFNEVGVNSGSHGTNFGTNKVYGNGVFQNVHSAVSGEHAYEIAGTREKERVPNVDDGTASRLEGTYIRQWLNLDSDYTGNRHIGADVTPSTYFLLIGTNDLLGDNQSNGGVSAGTNYEDTKQHLLGTQGENNVWSGDGDMDRIIKAMRDKSGENVDIVLLTVPVWNGSNNNPKKEDAECVMQYNESLKKWAEWKGVKVVDINFGMVDVANPNSHWKAWTGLFPDQLHPGPQGELIIAGNVARALGYAGRTAGQQRKAAADFSQHVGAQQIAAGQTFTQSWSGTVKKGFTVDFTLGKGGVGNGSEGGWNTTNNFSVSIGDGSHFGTLNINEAYIKWGNTILFSMDTSKLKDSLRIAYVYGNSVKNLPGGFYVWMNDQLIGEGLRELDNGTDAVNGLEINNNSEGDVSLENLDLDYENSWAPSPTGVNNGNPEIITSSFLDISGEFPGKKTWASADELLPTDIELTGNQVNVHASLGDTKGGTIVSTAAGTNQIYINSDTCGNDIYVTLSRAAEFQRGGFLTFHGAKPAGMTPNVFTGNGYLRVVDLSKEISFGTFIGTANTSGQNSVVGNLYFEFSSALATIANYTYTNVNVNVAIGGVYNARGGITGAFRVVINDGAIGNIIGGSFNGNSRVGSVEIFLNGGVLTGNVAAGGFFGSVGERSITITGDNVDFSEATKLITAGAVPAGSNLFGTATPNGTVDGNATVTLADMSADANFRQWKGTLSGGQSTDGTRTLVFAGMEKGSLSATLENFDVIVVKSSKDSGASDVELSSLGGATEIQVEEDNSLTLLAAAEGEVVYGTTEVLDVKNDGVITLQKGVTLQVNTEHRAQNVSTWVVDGGKLIMGENVEGKHDVTLTDGATLSVNGGRGEYTVTAEDAGNKVIVGENTGADFNLTMGADSAVTVGAGASGNYTISYTGGGITPLTAAMPTSAAW